MLALTRYSNAIYLFMVACAVLFATTMNVFFSKGDTASRVGGLIGAVGVGVVLGLPYFLSFQAARLKTATQIKRAMVANTFFLTFCALIAVVGVFSDPLISFGAVLWSLPALIAVNTFKSLSTSQTSPNPSN